MSKGTSRLRRCIGAPIRALSRARDFYIKSMIGCAGRVQYAAAAASAYPVISGVPRSYSLQKGSGCDDDLRELIRAASQVRSVPISRVVKGGAGGKVVVTRSQSVVIGRIDEDKPCEFEDDVRVGSKLLFPRSKSCAVAAAKGRIAVGAPLIA